jgi:predicted O-linked N-acetylglucosamine transferase (SPINDLY family)
MDPRHAEGLHLLGVIASMSGQVEAALGLFDAALVQSPRFADAHANRGWALFALGRGDHAIAACREALKADPAHVHANFVLGNTLDARGDLTGAEAGFRQALAGDPNHVEARSNLGRVLRIQGRLDAAIEALAQALAIQPGSADLHLNMGVALQHAGRVEEALVHYRQALALQPDDLTAHSNVLMALNYIPEFSGEQLLEQHRDFGARHTDALAASAGPYANDRSPDRRLRVGYISGDLHSHPVGYYLTGPLEAHDRSAVEVFCYSNNLLEDQVTARLAGASDHWRRIAGLADEDAAELIRADRIDILVDLSGHTGKNRLRLFGIKPAPVQVSWLGYPGTTGMAAIDYLVVDACTVPPGAEGWIREARVRLPHGRFCYSPPADAPEVAMPPSRPVTFGSFNNGAKLGPEVMRLWARVLDAVPGSRLVLKWRYFGEADVRRRLIEAFAAAGVDPGRLEVRGDSPHAEMLAQYADIDIALDPFPFCGGLTSSEALWMGVPVVTLPQDRMASRQTLAFLHGIGLGDLAANSEDDYVRIAAALAADPARRGELRRTLRPRMAAAPMNDPKVFTPGLEAAYRQMWRRWCEGQPPEAITIEG